MEQTTGPHGIPMEDALNPDLDGWFEVDDTVVDYAQAAWDRHQKDTKGKETEPGVVLRVVDTRGRG